jgi:hypothetical protein
LNDHQNKVRSILATTIAAIVVSPLDDIALSAVFGSTAFGFGSTSFYMLVITSTAVSLLIWKRHLVASSLKHLLNFVEQKHHRNQQTLKAF